MDEHVRDDGPRMGDKCVKVMIEAADASNPTKCKIAKGTLIRMNAATFTIIKRDPALEVFQRY
jgi:hypothetical protein